MTQPLEIILLTLIAGTCIPVGGLLARTARFRPNWLEREFRHFVIALGGGVLLGAVATVLIPEGMVAVSNGNLGILVFLLGGLIFFLVERQLGLKRREAPQLVGMLLDFIPESIALGGLIALNSPSAGLLAILIGLQNLPEGFNSYREIISFTQNSPRKTLTFMLLLLPLGPLAGLCGYYFLAEHQNILGLAMLFASGGILYLIFQDIAPQSRLEKHWAPPLGAVLGVAITLAGQQLLQASH